MATTENGIYYPNDGTKAADILADLKAMAESIDKNIQENKFDDTEIKQEQIQQNADIENLQINDSNQDSLISKLKQALINVETEEAKSLHIEDASTIPAQLEVLGNQEQETREGYNLLDVLGNKSSGTTQTVNGVTYTVNKDGSIKVNGTATDNADYFIAGIWGLTEAIIKLNGTYKLQLVDNNNTAIRIYLLNQSSVITSATNSTSLTKTQDVTGWFIRVNAGQTVNTTIYPQLVEGTEDKAYEQYGASPSPNYLSPIKCLGNNKNMLDLKAQTENGITVTKNADDTLNLVGTATTSGSLLLLNQNIILKPNKSYTFSIKKINGEDISNSICFWNNTDKNSEITLTLTKNVKTFTFTKETTLSSLYLDYNEGDAFDITLALKVEEGTEATSYSPYRTR